MEKVLSSVVTPKGVAKVRVAWDVIRISFVVLAVLACLYLLLGNTADAMTGDSKLFGDIFDKVKTYMTGTLGAIIALCVFIAGAVQTIRSGQIFFVMTGIALAIILYNAPTVVSNMMDMTSAVDPSVITSISPADLIAALGN